MSNPVTPSNVPITPGAGAPIAVETLPTGEDVQFVKLLDGRAAGKMPVSIDQAPSDSERTVIYVLDAETRAAVCEMVELLRAILIQLQLHA